MANRKLAWLAVLSLCSLSPFFVGGCSEPKELTPSKIKAAFKNIKGLQDGNVTVNGIRVGQGLGGVTIADITLTNLRWYGSDGNRKIQTYSGPAVAVFTGYTDGRWKMERFELPDGGSFEGNKNDIADETPVTIPWQVIPGIILAILIGILWRTRRRAANQKKDKEWETFQSNYRKSEEKRLSQMAEDKGL